MRHSVFLGKWVIISAVIVLMCLGCEAEKRQVSKEMTKVEPVPAEIEPRESVGSVISDTARGTVDVVGDAAGGVVDVVGGAAGGVADAVGGAVNSLIGKKYEANWESLDTRPTPQWFSDAKFGIFIHWGVYSVPAWGPVGEYAEWYWKRTFDANGELTKTKWGEYHEKTYGKDFAYADFAPMFKCENYDPDHWADVFKRSGAKYVVLTSKHHEGFTLWPNKEASKTWGRPWNAVETGPKRDILGDLTTAVKKQGIKMGFYYSLYEWYNPLWLDKDRRAEYVDTHMLPQARDLVTHYKPDILWADGEWDMPAENWRSAELLAWLFNESPVRNTVAINDRWGKGCRHNHGGYYTTEYGAGLAGAVHPWEECRGMGHSFGYNQAEGPEDYKPTRDLLLVLIDLTSRGGSLLLDIGPTGDGRIPEIMEERLLEMGDWLAVNGEAIYGTKTWKRDCQWSEGKRPDQEYKEYKAKYNVLDVIGDGPKDGKAVKEAFFTSKGNSLYAIMPTWPGSEFVLKDIQVTDNAVVTLLGHEGKLSWKKIDAGIAIDLSGTDISTLPKYAWTLKVKGKIE